MSIQDNACGGPPIPEPMRLIAYECLREMLGLHLGMRTIPPIEGVQAAGVKFLAAMGSYRSEVDVPRAAIELSQVDPTVAIAANLAAVMQSTLGTAFTQAVKSSICAWLRRIDYPDLARRIEEGEWAKPVELTSVPANDDGPFEHTLESWTESDPARSE